MSADRQDLGGFHLECVSVRLCEHTVVRSLIGKVSNNGVAPGAQVAGEDDVALAPFRGLDDASEIGPIHHEAGIHQPERVPGVVLEVQRRMSGRAWEWRLLAGG